MNIAVLSGKGGTGKTTVAVNLAATMGWHYVDCDIEEPNGWMFLQPELEQTEPVTMPSPVVDSQLCTHCGACAHACQFHALSVPVGGVMVFPALCHGCGLCTLVCPTQAISEQAREIGRIDRGKGANGECWQGVLHVGEPSGVRIIDSLLQNLEGDTPVVLDCAPGASCNVVAAIKKADFALLVTEATPFGAHDLNLSIQLIKSIGLPGAIVVNRSTGDDQLISDLAKDYSLPLVASLPFSRRAAATCAAGQLLQTADFRQAFSRLGESIMGLSACN